MWRYVDPLARPPMATLPALGLHSMMGDASYKSEAFTLTAQALKFRRIGKTRTSQDGVEGSVPENADARGAVSAVPADSLRLRRPPDKARRPGDGERGRRRRRRRRQCLGGTPAANTVLSAV